MSAPATTAPVSTGAFRRWSTSFDRCQSCGTADVKHKARGYCAKCYPKLPDVRERQSVSAKRTVMNMTAERFEAYNAARAEWVRRNRRRVNANYRAWSKRTQARRKYPTGSSCFVDLGGVVMPCVVVAVKGHRVKVELRDGEVIKTAANRLRDVGDDYGDVL